jgi:hypothetical protein
VKHPSAGAASHAIRPEVARTLSHASQAHWSSQSRRGHQHVPGNGYSSGKSCRRAPQRSIQGMPSQTSPLPIGFPPTLGDRGSSGNNDWIFYHCSSVSFVGSLAIMAPSHNQATTFHFVAQS